MNPCPRFDALRSDYRKLADGFPLLLTNAQGSSRDAGSPVAAAKAALGI